MKIEKLTENKIRVILSLEDLEERNAKLENLIFPSSETHNFFLDILIRAEKEVGFKTDGCKLLIEAFSSYNELFVFTITKYSEKEVKESSNISSRKKLSVRKKGINLRSTTAIYSFDNFEIFCDFCNNINRITDLDFKKIAKNISLYLYKSTYYLLLNGINTEYVNLNKFYLSVSEFGKIISCSEAFENKLLEHGKLIIKKNAIATCIKHFV